MRGKHHVNAPPSSGRRITPAGAGKTFASQKLWPISRITPAGAGKTGRVLRISRVRWDHPRRCGENLNDEYIITLQLGSPPQVRGKPPRLAGAGGFQRITPAGAGKTKSTAKKAIARWDHPRRCGENGRQSRHIHRIRWITPAGAGKTDRRIQILLRH